MTSTAAAPSRPRVAIDLNRWRGLLGLVASLLIAYALMVLSAGPQAQDQFINALTIGAIHALIALGYTMVYGIIELINFAHCELLVFGSFVARALLPSRA